MDVGPLDRGWFDRSRALLATTDLKEQQAVRDYTGTAHARINAWLRRPDRRPDPWVESRVARLDRLLAALPLERRTHLIRTVDVTAFGLTRGEQPVKLAGRQRIERSYLSTTRLPHGGRTKRYRTPLRLDVIVPPGTPAAALEDLSAIPGQGEILLGHGLGSILLKPAYDSRIMMWRATLRIREEV